MQIIHVISPRVCVRLREDSRRRRLEEEERVTVGDFSMSPLFAVRVNVIVPATVFEEVVLRWKEALQKHSICLYRH